MSKKVPSVHPPSNAEGTAQPLRIIVADHDPAACQFYREALARPGHQVFSVGTGPHLIEQCCLVRPDLVIASADLSETDGLTAAEEICRERPTPIILVGAEKDKGWVERALLNEHVAVCLHKPVKEADLEAAFVVAMFRFGRFQALFQEISDLRQALEDRKLVERAKGLVMRYADLDEEEALRRLTKLASDTRCNLAETARTVLVAGEVFQQMEKPLQPATPAECRSRRRT